MSWKEKIDNNLTLFVLGLLAAGFIAGFGCYKLLIEITVQTPSRSDVVSRLSWSEEAKTNGWLPKSECPADICDTLNSDNAYLKTSIAQCKNEVIERDNRLSQARTETNMLKARGESSEKTDRERVAQLNALHAQVGKINIELSRCRTTINQSGVRNALISLKESSVTLVLLLVNRRMQTYTS